MPKKGQAKKPAEAVAAQPAVDEAAATKDWKDTLTEDERQREEKKQKERQAKAEQAQAKQAKANADREWYAKEQAKAQRKQQREDNQWEKASEATLKRAIADGLLVSQEGQDSDGNWCMWVDLGNDIWKQVKDHYFCPLCEKHLNDSTLASHLGSEAHQKKLAWNTGATMPNTGAAMPTAPVPACMPCAPALGATPAWSSPQRPKEEWEDITAEGLRRCIPCNKCMDGNHETTDDHRKRVQAWLDSKMMEKSGYPAPNEPYLAWVPADNGSSERWLKCLLCRKWVQDESSHCGSQAAPAGSKDHQKNLRNYGPGNAWYDETVTKGRLKYHPVTTVQSHQSDLVEC